MRWTHIVEPRSAGLPFLIHLRIWRALLRCIPIQWLLGGEHTPELPKMLQCALPPASHGTVQGQKMLLLQRAWWAARAKSGNHSDLKGICPAVSSAPYTPLAVSVGTSCALSVRVSSSSPYRASTSTEKSTFSLQRALGGGASWHQL